MTSAIQLRAVDFGEAGRLKGVVTLPANGELQCFSVILVSAGFTAKSGPYRLYAEIAESLAKFGIATMRFDLGGIGMSQTLHPAMSLEERTQEDIRCAIGFMAREYGFSKVLLSGLCSGAEDSFIYAASDARVFAAVLVDPHAFRTPGWYFRRFLSRHFINRAVLKLGRTMGIVESLPKSVSANDVEGFEGELVNYRYLERDRATKLLESILGRGCYVHYIYTGGRRSVFNHTSQFRRMFSTIKIDEKATVDFVPTIEHTQIFLEDRQKLVNCVVRRVTAHCERAFRFLCQRDVA